MKKKININMESLAGIQYLGLSGISEYSKNAILRLLQFGDKIHKAKILTNNNTHCFLLEINHGEYLAIKTGFSSGYSGEGPRTFSKALQILSIFGADIEEFEVSEVIIEKLDMSCLTLKDIEQINKLEPIRPTNWYEYVKESDELFRPNESDLVYEFPHVLPYAILDRRLLDLALNFEVDPDKAILSGYRRLEDIVRARTGIDEHGSKLFSKTFLGEDAKLHWKNMDAGEQTGRAQMFTATYMAYRNKRAHQEIDPDSASSIREFIQLNLLYILESESQELLPIN